MINLENPVFLPVLGHSLPVLLVYLLAGLGIWFISVRSLKAFDNA